MARDFDTLRARLLYDTGEGGGGGGGGGRRAPTQ